MSTYVPELNSEIDEDDELSAAEQFLIASSLLVLLLSVLGGLSSV